MCRGKLWGHFEAMSFTFKDDTRADEAKRANHGATLRLCLLLSKMFREMWSKEANYEATLRLCLFLSRMLMEQIGELWSHFKAMPFTFRDAPRLDRAKG